eukprot:403368108
MFYETAMFFGSRLQEIPVILDTSSVTTYVSTDECRTCRYTKFNRDDSKTLKYVDPSKKTITEYLEIYYPKHNRFVFSGQYFQDQICIDRDFRHCVPEGKFFGASADPGFDEASGLIGLKLSAGRKTLIEQLADQKIISQGIFGLYLQDSLATYKSQLRMGGYNTKLMGDGGEESIIYYDLIDKENWALQLVDATLGDQSYLDQPIKVEINPGSPLIAMPKSYFDKLSQLFIQGLKPDQYVCNTVEFCMRVGKCSQVPKINLRFKIQGADEKQRPLFYDVPSENYLYEFNNAGFKGIYCLLGLVGTVPEEDKKFVLGNTFLKNYYSIFDADNKRIGLTLDISNREHQIAEQQSSERWTVAVYGFIVFMSLVILGLIGLVVFVKVQKNRKLRLSDDLYTDDQKQSKAKEDAEKKRLLDEKAKNTVDFTSINYRDSFDARRDTRKQSI